MNSRTERQWAINEELDHEVMATNIKEKNRDQWTCKTETNDLDRDQWSGERSMIWTETNNLDRDQWSGEKPMIWIET